MGREEKKRGWRGNKEEVGKYSSAQKERQERERALSPALRDTGDGPISRFKISPLRHCPQQCWLTTVPEPRAYCFN